MKFKPEDLKIDIYRANADLRYGANCVRITHLPSGRVVKSEDDVHSLENQNRAIKMLEDLPDGGS